MTLTGLDAGAGLAIVCVEITEDTALGLGLTLNRFAKYSSSQPNSVSLSCSERFDQSIPTLDTTDAADGVRLGRGGDGVALVERSADLSRGRLRGRNTSEAEDTVEESVGRHCGWQLDVCLRSDLTAVARKRRELESKAKR